MSTSGNSDMSPSSSSEIIPIRAVKKSDSRKPHSSDSVSPEESVANSPNAKSSGGPRTLRGKERSKHNALKHGVFSKAVLLSDESKADFESLLKGVVEHFQPEGAFEEALVEKLAALMWRQQRVLVAEGAEIRLAREFLEWDKNREHSIEAERRARKDAVEAIFRLDTAYKEGLIWHIDNPVILDVCMELLGLLHEQVKHEGLNVEANEEILQRLYGSRNQKHLNETLYRDFEGWKATANVEEDERARRHFPPAEECKEIVLGIIVAEIRRVKKYGSESSKIESKRMEIKSLRQSVPDSPGLERLVRYETGLERQFDRTLSQLERIQRMRKGQLVPPPLKVDVSS